MLLVLAVPSLCRCLPSAVDPCNAVAMCHRGRALLMLHRHDAAHVDLSTALALLQGNGGKGAGGAAGDHGGAAAGVQADAGVVDGSGRACGSGTGSAHMAVNSSYWVTRIRGLLDNMQGCQGAMCE